MKQLAFIILDKEDRGTHKERHAMKRGSVVVEYLHEDKQIYTGHPIHTYRVLKSNRPDWPVGAAVKVEIYEEEL